MKKIFMWMIIAILTISGGMLLSGCTDSNDDPVVPEEPIIDPVTQESYINDKLMDLSVKPGESFYDYALGTWIKTHGFDDEGTLANLASEQVMGLMNAFQGSDDALASHVMKFATDSYTEDQALKDILGILKVIGLGDGNGIKNADFSERTRQDIVNYLGNMLNAGFSPLVTRAVSTNDGLFTKVLTAGNYSQELQKALLEGGDDYVILTIQLGLSRLMADGEMLPQGVAERILAIEKAVAAAENEQYSNNLRLRRHAAPIPPVKASALAAMTRAADDMTAADIYKELDVAEDWVDPKAKTVIDLILKEDVPTLCYYLCFSALSEFDPLIPSLEDPTFNLKNNVYQKLLASAPEIVSRIDYDILKSRGFDADGCRTIMEQMRTLMDQRIAALDWMGDATKAEAKKKLAAMKFNIGLPATRPGESLKLSGTNLMEDMVQLMGQRQQTLMALAGKSVADNGWDFFLQVKNLGDFGASYVTDVNQLYILPAFLSKELFPQDNEVMRYAVSFVFGHEMCHGFDADGAKYDANGTIKDWWAPADLAKFQGYQQQMVSLYNQLWQYDGVHANGQFTLEENMADLGGIRLAYELYRQKLIGDGLSTADLNHQLREFFLHYALVWQADPSQEQLAEALTGDTHSTGRNRVIGITRLMDEWYDLFNVTDGQWYLAPADRVKIW